MTTNTSPLLQLNNGVAMPALGLGVYQSSPEDTVRAVRSAIDCGYRLIDTAAIYGNERQVGQALAELGMDRGEGRREVFVTTKLWMHDFGHDEALRAFDKSMAKLGLDYLDLYLLHWPIPSDFGNTVASYQAAQKLLAEGRVRAIGVSNFTPAQLDDLIRRVQVVPAVNQVELHPFFAQPALQAADRKLGIITQAWSPIGGINRYGKTRDDASRDPLRHPTVAALAQKYGKTPAQIVLRWHLELGMSAIPKSVRPERIRENFDVFDFTLAPEEVQAISALDTGVRCGPDPDEVSRQKFKVTVQD